MEHPAIDIIHAVLADADPGLPDAFRRFKNDVWDLPVWVPGHPTATGGTNFLFRQEDGQPLPKLSMFSNENDARKLWGAGPCMAVPFKYAIYLANEKQYDLDLFLNRELLSLNHDKLLEMRDMVALQASGVAMPQEGRRQVKAVKKFIAAAREYCHLQPGLASLRVAIVDVKGCKSRIAALIVSNDGRCYGNALRNLGAKTLGPAWGFCMLAQDGEETALIASMHGVSPCYESGTYGTLLDRIGSMFGRVARIEADEDPIHLEKSSQ